MDRRSKSGVGDHSGGRGHLDRRMGRRDSPSPFGLAPNQGEANCGSKKGMTQARQGHGKTVACAKRPRTPAGLDPRISSQNPKNQALARGRALNGSVPFRLVGLVMLPCWLGGASCMLVQPRPEPAEDRTVTGGISPAAIDLSAVSWQPGAGECELHVAGQGTRSAEIWIPERTTPRTLIIFLHGAVITLPGVHADGRAQTRNMVNCLVAPALGFLDPIILAPRSPHGQWWERSDTEFVLGLVAAVRSRWPEVTARSVIAGYSNGGIGAWYFARLYPTYFTAAIPMAFNDTIVGESVLPIYAIQGTKDEQFDIEQVRNAVGVLKAKGQDVTLAEKYRGSHMNACIYTPELETAGHWLEEHAFAIAERARASGAR